MDNEMILLVNLSKGMLGEATSALLAALLVAQIQKTALARANTTHRTPFYLYLDEFQNYTTDNIEDILSESRKYALSLTLAHQFLDQLPREVRSAVLNNTGTMTCFRVGYHDARVLAKEIFPAPDFIQLPDIATTLRSFRIKDAGWDGLALELANLEPRQFWTRKRGAYDPIKQVSFNMPDPLMTHDLQEKIDALREASGQRFARKKQHHQSQSQPKGNDEDIPLWTS